MKLFEEMSDFNIVAPVVSNKYIYAGMWRRFFALTIDLIWCAMIGGVFGIIRGIVLGLNNNLDKHANYEYLSIVILIANIIGYIIFWVSYTSKWQATPGMRMMNIYIINEDGSRFENWAFFVRIIVSCVAFPSYLAELFVFNLSKYYTQVQIHLVFSIIWWVIMGLMIALRKDKRALHDMIARTYVVHGKL